MAPSKFSECWQHKDDISSVPYRINKLCLKISNNLYDESNKQYFLKDGQTHISKVELNAMVY